MLHQMNGGHRTPVAGLLIPEHLDAVALDDLEAPASSRLNKRGIGFHSHRVNPRVAQHE